MGPVLRFDQQEYSLPEGLTSIGSDPGCDVVLPEAEPLHLELYRSGGKVMLKVKSRVRKRRPLLIAGKPVSQQPLREGDRFAIGVHRLEVAGLSGSRRSPVCERALPAAPAPEPATPSASIAPLRSAADPDLGVLLRAAGLGAALVLLVGALAALLIWPGKRPSIHVAVSSGASELRASTPAADASAAGGQAQALSSAGAEASRLAAERQRVRSSEAVARSRADASRRERELQELTAICQQLARELTRAEADLPSDLEQAASDLQRIEGRLRTLDGRQPLVAQLRQRAAALDRAIARQRGTAERAAQALSRARRTLMLVVKRRQMTQIPPAIEAVRSRLGAASVGERAEGEALINQGLALLRMERELVKELEALAMSGRSPGSAERLGALMERAQQAGIPLDPQLVERCNKAVGR